MLERTTAIVLVETRTDVPRVRSETFVDYLISGELASSTEFAQELDLSRFSGLFERISEESQQTDVHSKKQKKIFKKQAKKYGLIINQARSREFAESKSEAERHACVFYDPKSQSTGNTDITHGEYGSVHSGKTIYDLFKNKKVPLIDIHTHPDNSPFSITDYTPFLVRSPDNRGRTAKSALVICPDLQVLALPTKTTPEISYLRANGYINKANKSANKSMEKRMEKLDGLCDRLMEKIEKQRRQTLKKIKNRKKKLTAEERHLLQTDFELFKLKIYEEIKPDDETDARLNRTLKRTVDKTLALGFRTQNNDLLQFAKEHSIQLYFSVDMAHFRAFSA